ncbi:MAG TPA: elongation factor G, partial [Polyangiaceae bacterium]|nr:elongation factor G [Polyangiaceae bacterium]
MAHVDAGKTTLTERLLFAAGALHRMGEVHHGSTTTDSDPLEQQKGITINSATVTCYWQDHELHLIDTPGHIDFNADVELALSVLDGAVVLLDGVAGVESQTEAVWHQADRYKLPRICFINKLDRAGANFERCLRSMVERLGAVPAVITLPLGSEAEFSGLVDLVFERALRWPKLDDLAYESVEIPPAMQEAVGAARGRLIEKCADFDEELADAYLAETPVAPELLVRALRRATLERKLVPTCCGSAYKKRGVQQLLDAVLAYLPAPSDRCSVTDEAGAVHAISEETAFAALAFKVMHDGFGQLSLLRVFSGTLEKGDRVKNTRSGKTERIGRLVRVFADRREPVTRARAGDIVGLIGVEVAPSDTLCDPERPLTLARARLPVPVVRLAIEAKTQADHEQLGPALAKLLSADPSLRKESDRETGQTLLAGLGELHLEVAIEHLRTKYRCKVRVGKPRVAYHEALSQEVKHEFKYSKQTGGPGQFAQVVLIVAPSDPGTGLCFENEIRGGAIPAEFVAGVRQGVEEAMNIGVLGGFPIVDAHVRLVDGATHVNDSSELAFKVAARKCFAEAAKRAGLHLLEPVMRLEVSTPPAALGDVLADLGARRGRVVSLGELGVRRVVVASVPL